MKQLRRGNIELKKTFGNNTSFEVIKWYDNVYFEKENEYPIVSDGMRSKTIESKSFVSESLFKLKQTCYVIASIENGIVNFVGDRFIDLDKKEIFDFVFLLRSGIKKSLKYKK